MIVNNIVSLKDYRLSKDRNFSSNTILDTMIIYQISYLSVCILAFSFILKEYIKLYIKETRKTKWKKI